MDFSWLDKLQDDVPPADVAQSTEEADLIALAKNVPVLHWQYDVSKGGPSDPQEHLGFITQSLTRVPGLESAVSKDENGIESFDSRFVASAALSLLAALARKVYGIKLDENYAQEIKPTI